MILYYIILELWMLIFVSTFLVILYKIWLWVNLEWELNRIGGSRSNDNGWAQACSDVKLSAWGDPDQYSRGRDKQNTQWFLGSNLILWELTKQPWALALVDYLGTFTNCIRKISLTSKLSTYSKLVRFTKNCHMHDANLAGNQLLDRWNTGLSLLFCFLTWI
jgi:hypothetical protein